jgi:hypothetical protein
MGFKHVDRDAGIRDKGGLTSVERDEFADFTAGEPPPP